MLDSEVNRYKDELDALQQALKQNALDNKDVCAKLEQKLKDNQEHIAYQDKLLHDETENF